MTSIKRLKSDIQDQFTREQHLFESFLHDRLGMRAPAAERSLRGLVLIMPDLLTRMVGWANGPGAGPMLRRLQGFLLTYVAQPSDLLSWETQGPAGLIDDAYLTGRAYLVALAERRGEGRATAGDEALAQSLPGRLETARQALPQETAELDRVVEDLLEGRREPIEGVLPV